MSDIARAQAEWVSALMDGELREEEFSRAIDYLEDSASARQTWDTYHLVGEVLRSGRRGMQAHDVAFIDRLRAELTSAAHDEKAFGHDKSGVEITRGSHAPAVNDSWWRRVVGIASIAVLGVVVWQVALWIDPGSSSGSAPALAQLPSHAGGVVASSEPTASSNNDAPVMLRDPQLDALLAAHRQHGGVSALQMPAGFLRNATFTETSR